MSSKPQTQQNVQSSNSGTSVGKQSSHLKEQQQATSGQQAPTSTPSLVVSVPLSTANVPGVNLNLTSNTSNSNSNNNNLSVPQQQQQQQQHHSSSGPASNTYQALRNESGIVVKVFSNFFLCTYLTIKLILIRTRTQ